MDWYVCDMDQGILRIERTLRAALGWAKDHEGADHVLGRTTYAPGYHSYLIGQGDDFSEFALVRADKLVAYGITDADIERGPVYPHIDDPHEARES